MRTSAFQTTHYLMAALAIVGLVSTEAFATEGPVGKWNISVDAQGQMAEAVLIIVEEDGKYSGTQVYQGELELSEVSFEDGELSFKLEVEGAGMFAEFTATIDGDLLKGKYILEDLGIEMITTGTRAGGTPASVAEKEYSAIVDPSDTTKYEFCSEAWVALARDYLVNAVGDADFGDAGFSFSETFTDAPANLAESDSTSTGWYVIVADGELRVEKGILPDADIRITADYATVLPLARMVFEGNPEGVAEAAKLGAAAAAAGKMSTEGDMTAMAKVPTLAAAFAKLHDALARRTL